MTSDVAVRRLLTNLRRRAGYHWSCYRSLANSPSERFRAKSPEFEARAKSMDEAVAAVERWAKRYAPSAMKKEQG